MSKNKKNIKKYNCEIIDRPRYLCNSTALGEDVYKHAYEYIMQKEKKVNSFVLLMANAPLVTMEMINKGIFILKIINLILPYQYQNTICESVKSKKIKLKR